MTGREIFISLINDQINEMNHTIDCLYTTSDACAKNRLLSRLRKNTASLSLLVQASCGREKEALPLQNQLRTFTPEELSKYNGRSGNPAYIAVDGTVYDVTGNAAWGGAAHFGLSAGNDLSGQFAPCHAGQPVLNKLKVVGKIAE